MPGITTARRGPIGTLTIDNPERRNAMTASMYRAVPTAIAELLDEPTPRVIVIRGAGDEAFGAGSDISEFPTQRLGPDATAYDASEHAAWHALASIPVPVIAAIHGPCMGGGIALALHCDVRVAATDASFAVPPARLGLAFPQEALHRLVDLVGPAQAKLLLYSAKVVDAQVALSIGLVEEVVPKEALDARIDSLADDIARLAPMTHRATKLGVEAVANPPLTEMAAAAALDCYHSSDFREGVEAFLEKRRPTFEGR